MKLKTVGSLQANDLSLESSRREGSGGNADTWLFDNSIERWFTTEEAANFLRISVGSLLNMVSNGQVPYYKLCGRNRYRLDDLRGLLIQKGGSDGNQV